MDWAKATDVRLEVRSPPGGASNLGPTVFQEIVKELEQTHSGIFTAIILDCGSDAGLAMAALRSGCRDICVDVPGEVRKKLTSIATALEARIHGQAELTLDLSILEEFESGENDFHSLNSVLCNYFRKDPMHG